MRGSFFGRNKAEKPQPTVNVVNSYAEAVYPPRAYRHYHQPRLPSSAVDLPTSGAYRDRGVGSSVASVVVIPSINADAVCEPHMRSNTNPLHVSQDLQQIAKKASPPLLRSHVDCFVHDTSGAENASFEQCGRYAEPLNVFHYYDHLAALCQPCDSRGYRDDGGGSVRERTRSSGGGTGGEQGAYSDRDKRARLDALADLVALPHELRTYTAARGPYNVVSSLQPLRARTAKRPTLVQPLRRGSKVVVTMPTRATATTTREAAANADKPTMKRGRGEDAGQPSDARGAARRRRYEWQCDVKLHDANDVKMERGEAGDIGARGDNAVTSANASTADALMADGGMENVNEDGKQERRDDDDDGVDQDDEDVENDDDDTSLDMSVEADDDDNLGDFDDGSDGGDEYM